MTSTSFVLLLQRLKVYLMLLVRRIGSCDEIKTYVDFGQLEAWCIATTVLLFKYRALPCNVIYVLARVLRRNISRRLSAGLGPFLIMVTFVIAHSQFKLNCAPILRLTVGAHFIILILVEFNSNFVHETELDKFLRVVTWEVYKRLNFQVSLMCHA